MKNVQSSGLGSAGILASVFGLLGFGRKAKSKEAQMNKAPEQSITPAGTQPEAKTVEKIAQSPSATKARKLARKRQRWARKNSRRFVGNPKHLMTRDVRLVA